MATWEQGGKIAFLLLTLSIEEKLPTMGSENSFFFVKSFDREGAESFVNKNLLTSIDRAVIGTAKFVHFSHVLTTDHGYGANVHYYESLTLTFTYLSELFEYISGEWRPARKAVWGRDTEALELALLLICEVPFNGTEDKVIGGYDPDQRARYIYTWTIERAEVRDLETKINEPELLREIESFIEVAEVNAYWRYEKKHYDRLRKQRESIEDFYATMYDGIRDEPSPDFFCERCQESPCTCSDPDPG